MYESSEDALADHRPITLDRARAELRRHGCRIIDSRSGQGPLMLQVTNDCDEPEWVACTPHAIMVFLGY